MSRTVYPAGGAYGTWNSATIQSREDWMVTDDPATFETTSNTRGKLLDRIGDLEGKLTLTPKAFSSGLTTLLGKLLPYKDPGDTTYGIGKTIFPATDLPFVIAQKDGKTVTYPAAAVSKMPALTFHTAKPLLGSMEFTLLTSDQKNLTDSGAWASYTEPAVDPGTEVFDRYTLTLDPAGTPVSFTADDDGIVVTPVVTLQKIKPAMRTTSNYRVSSIGCQIEFTPLDMDVDTFYSTYFPPVSAGLGGAVTAAGKVLHILGSATGNLKLIFNNVAPLKPGGPQWSNSKPRQKKVTLGAYQGYSSGLTAIWSITTVP
jgi:hypothetical protein